MLKEYPIALAQIIQSVLPVRCCKKTVFRAFSMTHVSHIALQAMPRKLISLFHPEIKLSLRFGQLYQRTFRNVAKEILGIDKMVA